MKVVQCVNLEFESKLFFSAGNVRFLDWMVSGSSLVVACEVSLV